MSDCQISCFGLSHHDADVEIRERMRFVLLDVAAALSSQHVARQDGNGNGKSKGNGKGNGNGNGSCKDRRVAKEGPFSAVREMVLLSTCNRVELYVCTAKARATRAFFHELVTEASHETRRRAGLEPGETYTREQVDAVTYHLTGNEAIHHLCEVACGLDSAVLGETQILTQVREALERAREQRLAGPVMSAVFKSAHRAGKQARRLTAISRNPSSVSSAAVAIARKQVGDFDGREVMVLGLGEMGMLALKTLCAVGATRLHITNRTTARAVALAHHISHNTNALCAVSPLAEMERALRMPDVLITAASGGCLVEADVVRKAMAERDGRDLVIVDIAVPRNVAPEVGEIAGVQLFDTDDIHTAQDEALDARRREIPRVMSIIEEEMTQLGASLRELRLAPLITELRQKAEQIRQRELARTYRKLGSPDAETWSHVQHLSSALVKKLFHEPTTFIREKAALGAADEYAPTIRELFGLGETDEEHSNER